MQILPLTTKTLPSAIKLRDSIFKNIPINDVITLTGIYSELGDIDTAWLGWFGVDDSIRNNGIGQNLLDFSINQAKKLDFSHLNISS
jgi:GNAT superfamily N-acetyltransferase